MEGTLALDDGKLALRHFLRGEIVFESLEVGQVLEIFQNGDWHRAEILSIDDEPYFANWNYGNGVGCEARLVKED